jgi:hypothetical protein
MNKKWTLPVQQNIDGEFYIELNDEILEGSGFAIGDTLDWKDNKDGSFTLTKVEGDLYLVESISIFHIKHVVRAKNAEHAMDEVVMENEDLNEFSQKHIDNNILNARKITPNEYLEMFDKDNAYLSSWSEDKKFSMVNIIDYGKHYKDESD